MSQVIDEQLYAAIEQLNEEQKSEVLIFACRFLAGEGKEYDKWEDPDFVREMEEGYKYYRNGGKMITQAEADERVKRLSEQKNNEV